VRRGGEEEVEGCRGLRRLGRGEERGEGEGGACYLRDGGGERRTTGRRLQNLIRFRTRRRKGRTGLEFIEIDNKGNNKTPAR
jgi:hypothetical protein